MIKSEVESNSGEKTVRHATQGDAEAIATLFCRAFPSLYLSAFGGKEIENLLPLVTQLYREGHLPYEHTLVSERGGEVIGVMSLNLGESLGAATLSSYSKTVRANLPFFRALRAIVGGIATERFLNARIPRAPDLLYIEALAVAETERGKGTGTLLLQRAEEYALQHSRSLVTLHVLRRNADARRLYERFGFREISPDAYLHSSHSLIAPLVRLHDPGNRWVASLMEKNLKAE